MLQEKVCVSGVLAKGGYTAKWWYISPVAVACLAQTMTKVFPSGRTVNGTRKGKASPPIRLKTGAYGILCVIIGQTVNSRRRAPSFSRDIASKWNQTGGQARFKLNRVSRSVNHIRSEIGAILAPTGEPPISNRFETFDLTARYRRRVEICGLFTGIFSSARLQLE